MKMANKKHNCENCIHKVVCALWEIQVGLDDSECVYYQPTLTPQNEWVSVNERWPEPTYCVLVYTTDYSIEVDARGNDGEWMSHEVTHWMPLPEPPTKEDQK